MSRHKSLVLLPLLLVLLLAVPANSLLAVPANQPKNLHLIKKIYLDKWDGKVGPKILATSALYSDLKQELTDVGFEVVESAANADAVLTCKVESWRKPRWYDERPGVGLQSFDYGCKLMSPQRQKLWEFSLNYDYDYYAKDEPASDIKETNFVVRKLLEAWLKSAAKAGVKINGRVQ